MQLKSPLFAPGDSARKIDKALASAADAVILDLEDSVAAPAKPEARAAVAARLRALGADPRRQSVIVRVNPRATPWYLADLAAVVPAGAAAVMLPKCDGPEALRALDHHLEALEAASGRAVGEVRVVAIATETAGSVFTLGAYAPAPARLAALCFGAEDISADLGAAPRHPDGGYNAAALFARAQVLAAAGALGVPAIDTPYPDPRDPDGLRREAALAAADGFAGKILIHPDQIDIVNAAFTPPPEQVRWAERVCAHFAANPDSGVFALDGKMIDRPHHRLALRVLAAVGRASPG
ncbi:MAG: CoA ester lyase [Acetobacteraceae bacterium]|nr:CoA ester lyase [Acetobacteraceae bacterium]MBV9115735.1 CoA ester lyase [Acetobacteraceae bacterium]